MNMGLCIMKNTCFETFNHFRGCGGHSSLITGFHPALFILNPVAGVLRTISTLNSHKYQIVNSLLLSKSPEKPYPFVWFNRLMIGIKKIVCP
jgi:hypothetical protein